MPKHYKDMIDELINKMDEDAPANSVAGGGVDLNPTGARMSPKMMKRKKEQGDEQDKITKKISKMVKENEDNNNVILKQVNESLSKVEDKSDEKLGLNHFKKINYSKNLVLTTKFCNFFVHKLDFWGSPRVSPGAFWVKKIPAIDP